MASAILLSGALASVSFAAESSAADAPAPARPALTGWAQLPARTFLPDSEPSGRELGTTPINGVAVPFDDQPVQGFSGMVPNGDGTYTVVSDNGYAYKNNSADFVLRVNRVRPDWATGAVELLDGFFLSDPDSRLPFPLTRADRILTGADLDPESIVRVSDGTYWIGDEFGPLLFHVDAAGRVLGEPRALPGVRAPENPYGEPANVKTSKGLESLTISPDGRYLYPLLEGSVDGDPAGRLRMYEFDLATETYTDRRWAYQLDKPNFGTADAVAVDTDRLLVIERDNTQGTKAAVKRVYLVDRRDADGNATMDKRLLVNLLDIANPQLLHGFGETFRFPFQCVEGISLFDDRTIVVTDDNNLPLSSGRSPGAPDDNEFIRVELPEPLGADPRLLPQPPARQ
jgi:hypothetical protein